ncbi:MAG: hypothetical protein A3J30_02600 [Candidatus Wildermuthbacteria bacterium RIFCSPLOWO2_02_FULL_47_9c]|uniref:Nucleotidase n=2 Tax=Parcubacteria group TaxID=1794811 RepID=A0A837ILG8_9BACT|nr:MAG: hypothetical protein UY25_C0002G0126 [Candidatus Yanofskybacteria bacterium GW2011_GWC1_48_11]KKW04625.1 MAG: hypothetical protein UY38_C0001G0192 [Parcubacteria group bacterium GW2011_GWB1_49_12]KKW09117.1 MAG: hypothetical protein UY45_C0001G0003 [Parcubacteria group bacterium GW2011_GWA1_49_26]OHA61375.1 MAG: hypothetical protein A2109_00620 [Candidatus Wildermuthbacteria bacterium GWA1_49_26]OHA66282.1 MAG: hypothetical protein A2674_02415 [Candidatus Wildermuthbacteria bacterium RI
MGNRLVIGTDLDGVIIRHVTAILAACEQQKVPLLAEETNSNLFRSKVGDAFYRAVADWLYREGTYQGEQVRGAFPVLWRLKSSWRVIVVSARHPDAVPFAQTWLGDQEFHQKTGIGREDVFFCAEEQKGVILVRERAQVYIDDKLSVLEGLPPDILRIFFDPFCLVRHGILQPPAGIVVATRWIDIEHIIVQRFSQPQGVTA